MEGIAFPTLRQSDWFARLCSRCKALKASEAAMESILTYNIDCCWSAPELIKG